MPNVQLLGMIQDRLCVVHCLDPTKMEETGNVRLVTVGELIKELSTQVLL